MAYPLWQGLVTFCAVTLAVTVTALLNDPDEE